MRLCLEELKSPETLKNQYFQFSILTFIFLKCSTIPFEEIEKFLAKYSHSINELDEKKLTPLHYAARSSNIEVMKILFEHGANANKLGDDDMTPLHYAAR